MSFASDALRFVNCIVTLGGSEELIEAKEDYDQTYVVYKAHYDQATLLKSQIDKDLEAIGEAIASVTVPMNFCQKVLSQNFSFLQNGSITSKALTQITSFNASYNSALTAGFGGLVGGSAAAGAWAVVSVIGSASTGTAIASLSGVAATNATMAWFGGGALAAGGAGMSGGMMVLGGIVAAPIIYFAAKGSYKKAAEVREEHEKLKEAFAQICKQEEELSAQQKPLLIYKDQITSICQTFVKNVHELEVNIYPSGLWSQLFVGLKSVFSSTPYSMEQQSAIKLLLTVVEEFLNQFSNTKLPTNQPLLNSPA